MITSETAAMIWQAYREIASGEKLLADLQTERARLGDRHAPTLCDAFGRARHLQLGVPCGENAHRLFDVSPALAESVIRAHIENKRAELREANERARIELGGTGVHLRPPEGGAGEMDLDERLQRTMLMMRGMARDPEIPAHAREVLHASIAELDPHVGPGRP